VERTGGLFPAGSFLFFALPRHPALTPLVRAHYLIHSRACLRCDGCQLVGISDRLICGEKIFKGLSMTGRCLVTLGRFVGGLGELCAKE